jgi:hypothetical protein
MSTNGNTTNGGQTNGGQTNGNRPYRLADPDNIFDVVKFYDPPATIRARRTMRPMMSISATSKVEHTHAVGHSKATAFLNRLDVPGFVDLRGAHSVTDSTSTDGVVTARYEWPELRVAQPGRYNYTVVIFYLRDGPDGDEQVNISAFESAEFRVTA